MKTFLSRRVLIAALVLAAASFCFATSFFTVGEVVGKTGGNVTVGVYSDYRGTVVTLYVADEHNIEHVSIRLHDGDVPKLKALLDRALAAANTK